MITCIVNERLILFKRREKMNEIAEKKEDCLSRIERLHARSETLFLAVLKALQELEAKEEIFNIGESNHE